MDAPFSRVKDARLSADILSKPVVPARTWDQPDRVNPAIRRQIHMKKPIYILVVVTCLLAPTVWAKEGGDQYSNGAENWFAGATPPAGFYYINYSGYYSGELKDGSGRNAVLNGTTPSVHAAFDALRFIEMTKLKIFGADYGVHVIVPV